MSIAVVRSIAADGRAGCTILDMGQPAIPPAMDGLMQFVVPKKVERTVVAPEGEPGHVDVERSVAPPGSPADIPPVIRTEEGWEALQEMLASPPRDMPKLQELLQRPSPFADA